VTANVPRQIARGSVSSPVPIRSALEHWCSTGAAGALRILGPPGGNLFLVDGRIAYAECPLATGIAELLTASGRVPPQVWTAALEATGPTDRVGDVLVRRGDITGAELELATRSALFSAALFQLCADAPVHFEMGARHRAGSTRSVEFELLCTEVDRRRALLFEAWPDDVVDTAAVRPVGRFPGHHVALTSAQWAIVAIADRVRTPVDIARLLGLDTFALLLEARWMARNGLIEAGVRSVAAIEEVHAAAHTKTEPEVTAEPTEAEPEVPADLAAIGIGGPSRDLRPLPRRRARVHPPARHRHDDPAVPSSTLIRLRRALEEKL
jgi:hypothetical protein